MEATAQLFRKCAVYLEEKVFDSRDQNCSV